MRAYLAMGTAALLLGACASPTRFSEISGGLAGPSAVAANREAQLTGTLPATGFAAPAVPMTSPYGMTVPPGSVPTPPGGIATSDLVAVGIGVAPGASPTPVVGFGVPPTPVATAPGGMVAVASSNVPGDVNILRSSGLEASPSNAAPALVGVAPTATPSVPATAGTGISDEQNFDAVASRETIESDAARRAAQAAQYQVIQPSALPPPPTSTGPNIVEYALSAPNSVGQEWYSRFVFSGEGRQLRNCAGYSTPDEAQRDFLARGGPDRDPRGLDPDGDGFACAWDPAPFRAAVGRG